MRNLMSYLFVGCMATSLLLVGCPKKVTKAARKVLNFGKDYKTKWTKINKSKVISAHHGNTEKDVYANDAAHKVFMGVKKPPYPKGAAFLVIHFKNSERQGFAYTMQKMGPDYDPDRGNWRYTIVRLSDWTIETDGLIAVCVKCHQKGQQSDYIRLDRKLFQKSGY